MPRGQIICKGRLAGSMFPASRLRFAYTCDPILVLDYSRHPFLLKSYSIGKFIGETLKNLTTAEIWNISIMFVAFTLWTLEFFCDFLCIRCLLRAIYLDSLSFLWRKLLSVKFLLAFPIRSIQTPPAQLRSREEMIVFDRINQNPLSDGLYVDVFCFVVTS